MSEILILMVLAAIIFLSPYIANLIKFPISPTEIILGIISEIRFEKRLFFIIDHFALFRNRSFCSVLYFFQYIICEGFSQIMFGSTLQNREVNYMKFQRIQDLRTDADMSQKQLSEILHISQRSYSHYETGSRNIPVEMLIRLANYYDISVDYLVGRTDKKEMNK